MWPIWNLLPTQPVQTGPVAAAWALRLSLLTFLRDNTALHLPPTLLLSPPRPTVSALLLRVYSPLPYVFGCPLF